MDELENMGSYSAGFEDGRRQAESDEAWNEVVRGVFSLLGSGAYLILLFFPSLFLVYTFLEKYRFSGKLRGWNYFWIFIGTVFLIEMLVLLLRSLSQSLKRRGNWIWILPQTIYFLYCFAFPALLGQSIIWLIFRPSQEKPTSSFTLISWIIGLAIGGYYYLICERRFRSKAG